MSPSPPPTAEPTGATSHRRGAERTRSRIRPRGGPDGNEQLTAATGVILLILLAVLGVTILRIGQLISVHLFLGLLLIGPVGLKMGSTGYRFVRYYTHTPGYRRKGPPEMWLRVLAPAVIVSTVVVFVSGVLLLFEGPAHRSTLLLIHKVSFFAWLAVTGLHVLGHLPGMPAALRIGPKTRPRVPGHDSDGAAGRVIALIGALVGGLVLALVLIPDFSGWTSAGSAVFHHHQHR